MELKSISATRIRTLESCPLKYKFNYHSDLERPMYDHNRLGIAVHEISKEIDSLLSKEGRFPEKEDYEWAREKFMSIVVEQELADQGYIKLGLEMTKDKLDNFDPTEKIIALEERFPHNAKVHGIKMLGALDKVSEADEDTLVITDYKTSRMAMTPYEARDDTQMSFYDLAGHIIYPQYKKIILVWDYLRPNMGQVKIVKTKEERDTFSLYVKEVIKRIKGMLEEDAKPRINKFCGWCEFNLHCPAYKTFLGEMSEKEFKPAELLTDEELVEAWEELSVWKKILDNRERDVKMSVHNRVQETGTNVVAKGRMLYSVQNSRVQYEAGDLKEFIPAEDLLKMVNVNKKALDSYIIKHPEHAELIMQSSSIAYSSPFFRIKKIKED